MVGYADAFNLLDASDTDLAIAQAVVERAQVFQAEQWSAILEALGKMLGAK